MKLYMSMKSNQQNFLRNISIKLLFYSHHQAKKKTVKSYSLKLVNKRAEMAAFRIGNAVFAQNH